MRQVQEKHTSSAPVTRKKRGRKILLKDNCLKKKPILLTAGQSII